MTTMRPGGRRGRVHTQGYPPRLAGRTRALDGTGEDDRMARWSVVVPVKRLAFAKTRLRGLLPAGAHEQLVLAMALDTVAATLACAAVAEVVVVTDDPDAAERLSRCGARVVADGPAPGLNAALEHGARWVRARAPDGAVAALGADLPALRPGELAAALAVLTARTGRGFVPDAAGTGTTLLAATAGHDLLPAFGAGSARAHGVSGAVALVGAWPSLRQDVDTFADLLAATALGVGPHLAALAELPAALARHPVAPAAVTPAATVVNPTAK